MPKQSPLKPSRRIPQQARNDTSNEMQGVSIRAWNLVGAQLALPLHGDAVETATDIGKVNLRGLCRIVRVGGL